MLTNLSTQLVGDLPAVPSICLLFACGMVLLLMGWQTWRVTLFLVGAIFGGAAGYAMAPHVSIHPLFLMIPLALVAGILALVLQRIGAFMAGGLCAAMPVLAFRADFAQQGVFWTVCAFAFLAGGLITLWLWRPMIIASLAVIGAAMVSDGAMMTWRHFHAASADEFLARVPWGPLALCGLLALLGIYMQMHHVEAPREAE